MLRCSISERVTSIQRMTYAVLHRHLSERHTVPSGLRLRAQPSDDKSSLIMLSHRRTSSIDLSDSTDCLRSISTTCASIETVRKLPPRNFSMPPTCPVAWTDSVNQDTRSDHGPMVLRQPWTVENNTSVSMFPSAAPMVDLAPRELRTRSSHARVAISSDPLDSVYALPRPRKLDWRGPGSMDADEDLLRSQKLVEVCCNRARTAPQGRNLWPCCR